MILKVRMNKYGAWGFLEKYSQYQYGSSGYVRAITSVTRDGKLSPAYVFKGEDFIDVCDIDESIGLDKYIKAKKPFYSKIGEGFVVVLKAEVDFVTKEYFPEKSTYEVFEVNGIPMNLEKGVPFKRIIDVPREFDEIVKEPMRILGESFGDRYEFLKGR